MATVVKPEAQPALTQEERLERLEQLTTDLEKAVDLAEEQRRILRDIARDANELAEAVSPDMEPALPELAAARRRRTTKKR